MHEEQHDERGFRDRDREHHDIVERAQIEADLARIYGRGIDTSYVDAPRLLGGVRITVGSDVYDGSIHGRLAALEEQF